MMGERCPYCGELIQLYEHFMSGITDYGTEFNYECEHCGEMMHVEVESTPVFDVKKLDDGS